MTDSQQCKMCENPTIKQGKRLWQCIYCSNYNCDRCMPESDWKNCASCGAPWCGCANAEMVVNSVGEDTSLFCGDCVRVSTDPPYPEGVSAVKRS